MKYSTGLELILNACEGVLQIGVTRDEKPLCFEEWHAPRKTAEILAPALEEICGRLELDIRDFRRIACMAGPGSFTGIRLVLATASALMRCGQAQAGSLDYMQALATSAAIRRGLLYPAKIFVLTHARRDLLHFQEFISYGPVIPSQPASQVELAEPGLALEKIGASGPCHVCGSGLSRHAALFECPHEGQGPAGAPGAVLMPELQNPDFAALRLLARHGDYFKKDVEPRYTRPCDALENLDSIAEKQGEDAAGVRARIAAWLARVPKSEE